jgi:hypothetical protein
MNILHGEADLGMEDKHGAQPAVYSERAFMRIVKFFENRVG